MRMRIRYVAIILAISLVALLAACSVDPYEATVDRPGIPLPTSYTAALADTSDIMIIEEAKAAEVDFQPAVTQAWNSSGVSIYGSATNTTPKRVTLMTDGATLAPSEIAGAPVLATVPRLVFERYWKLIEGPTGFPGFTSDTYTNTTTTSVSKTETESFTESISTSATVSAQGLFASGSVTASASFSATQEFTTTSTTSDTYSYSFTVSAIDGKDCVYAVWQLHERLRYIGADGETFTDPKYTFVNNSIVWDYPTNEVVPILTYF